MMEGDKNPDIDKGDTHGQTEDGNNANKNKEEENKNDDNEKGCKQQPHKKKYGFRLSPEEQELAYELKASTMRRLEKENEKVNQEMDLQRKMRDLKSQQRAISAYRNTDKNSELSRMNAIKLMKMYEKRSKEAEIRIKELEAELQESQNLARRFRDMYLKEKHDRPESRATVSTQRTPRDSSPKHENKKADSTRSNDSINKSKHNDSRASENDLDDDEAQFKRHLTMISETKSMRTTSPIRVTDVIRKSESISSISKKSSKSVKSGKSGTRKLKIPANIRVLILENDALKHEVRRLKQDNQDLLKRTKQSKDEHIRLLHAVNTSESAREELTKRLSNEQKKHRTLTRSLNRQAEHWINVRKEMEEQEEKRKWNMVKLYAVDPLRY